MADPITEGSPRLRARIAGVLYLGTIVGGLTGLSIRSAMIVHGDAAATTANILASEPLWRAGVAADLIGTACYVGVTAILYSLLKPVSRTISLLAAFFSLVGCAIGAAITVNLLAPLLLLGGAPDLTVFRLDQLNALARTALRLHDEGYNIGMINFGVYCTLLGFLVFNSRFLPRILGVLLVLAGVGWLTDSFATLLSPAFESHLEPYIMAPGFIGEASLCLWLILFGVNVPRWVEASAASPGG